MCINRPKSSHEIRKPSYIKVREKTNKSKYDFLRLYYTKWNDITKPSPRIIIDTHAGTGLVELLKRSPLIKTNESELIYGSPLLAILKTLMISNNLKIILNESDSKGNYLLLNKCVKVVKRRGLPIFEKIAKEFRYKSLETNRERKQSHKIERKFPESFNIKTPQKFQRIWKKTKAEIIINNGEIEENIDNIINNHLNVVNERTESLPKALFLVDPCGMVGWLDVIKKICERANKQEGTDLILNWSWDAIIRNINTKYRDSVLSMIYGIPIDKIHQEFDKITEMEDFLEKYKNQLRDYFKYVEEVGVPRDRKIKPRQSSHKKYYLIFCTNNKSALSLAGYQLKKIEIGIRKGIKPINYYFSR